ncbi:unnamed protein product, partial [Allacma fusca]
NYSFASQILKLPEIVVSHADDAQYFYKTDDGIPLPEPGSKDLMFSQNVIKLWVSFIKTGSPTTVYPNAHKWERFSPEKRSTLMLDLPAERS